MNHLGGWAGVYGRTDARVVKQSMAHRYCGRKAELEWQAKLEHWHVFESLFEAVVYPGGAAETDSSCVTWEMLTTVAAQSVDTGEGTLLAKVKQKALQSAASAVSMGYLDWAYGASEELRPVRFQLGKSVARGSVSEPPTTQVKLERSPALATALLVVALAVRVVHVRTAQGPPPEILCKHKKRLQRHLMSA